MNHLCGAYRNRTDDLLIALEIRHIKNTQDRNT